MTFNLCWNTVLLEILAVDWLKGEGGVDFNVFGEPALNIAKWYVSKMFYYLVSSRLTEGNTEHEGYMQQYMLRFVNCSLIYGHQSTSSKPLVVFRV